MAWAVHPDAWAEEMVMMRRICGAPSPLWGLVATFVVIVMVAGCGGGGGDVSTTTSGQSGAVSLAMTDAAHTDISVFTVDVTSIHLVTGNGAQISTLPSTIAVNFADLTGLSELIATANVPQGIYQRAVLDLNFATSDTLVVLANGNSTASGSVVLKDGSGGRPGTMQVGVGFDAGHPLVIGGGPASHVVLDFNLDQSLDVNESVTPNVVTIHPVFSGDADHLRPVVTRVRGLLAGVDRVNHAFGLIVRPLSTTDFGGIAIAVDASTTFGGEDFDNDRDTSRSLADLAAAPPRTPVIATADFSPTDGRFHASAVEYGGGMPGGNRDVADGLVTAFSGSTYTLLGATLSRSTGAVSYNVTVTATIDGHTLIHAFDASTLLAPNNIGIGQRLLASGILTGAPPGFSMNCTSVSTGTTGTVHLVPSEVIGAVVTSVSGTTGTTVTLNVKAVGRRPVDQFDFAGHGLDPTRYGVSAISLPAGSIPAGTFVVARGLATPLGAKPFTAITLWPFPDAQVLEIHWPDPGTDTPLVFPNGAAPVINFAGGGVATIASLAGSQQLPGGPTLLLGSSPAGVGIPTGPLAIAQDQNVTQYGGDSLLAWLQDLRARLSPAAQVQTLHAQTLHAVGSYNPSNNSFTLQAMVVMLQ